MPVSRQRLRLVFELADAGDLSGARLGDEADLVPALRQMARDGIAQPVLMLTVLGQASVAVE